MSRSNNHCRGFVHPEWMTILVLLALSTAFCLPLVRRLELSLLWLPLFVITVAVGFVLLIAGIGMLYVHVSESIDQRRRKRFRRDGFASFELLYVIIIFCIFINFTLPIAGRIAEQNGYLALLIEGCFLATFWGILMLYGRISEYIEKRRYQVQIQPAADEHQHETTHDH